MPRARNEFRGGKGGHAGRSYGPPERTASARAFLRISRQIGRDVQGPRTGTEQRHERGARDIGVSAERAKRRVPQHQVGARGLFFVLAVQHQQFRRERQHSFDRQRSGAGEMRVARDIPQANSGQISSVTPPPVA